VACVRKRRGRWVLDFTDGKGVRRWLTTKWSSDADKEKAEKLLARLSVQVEDGSYEPKREQRDFSQLVDSYVSQLDVREHTKCDYMQIINGRLRPYLGSMKLRGVTPQIVERYRAWVQEQGKAVRTVNKDLTLLSMMLKYAEGHRWITFNPCKHVKKLRQPIGHRRRALDGNILTASEAQRLIEAAGSQRDRVLFRMAIETGMRQGELLALRWDDIDWRSGRVYVRNSFRKGMESAPKTAASLRSIGLTATLLQALKRWKIGCPQPPNGLGLVFPNTQGGFEHHYNLLRRGFFPALRRAGLRRIRFHDLRHTCASLLLASGVNIKQVQAQLGHASVSITLDVYSHFLPDAESPGVQVFEELLSKSCDPNRGPGDPIPNDGARSDAIA
jgi:integrase